MVCTKCAKKLQKTELATPAVKRKTDMYYGSPSTSLGGGAGSKSAAKPSPTLGSTGVSKVSINLFSHPVCDVVLERGSIEGVLIFGW